MCGRRCCCCCVLLICYCMQWAVFIKLFQRPDFLSFSRSYQSIPIYVYAPLFRHLNRSFHSCHSMLMCFFFFFSFFYFSVFLRRCLFPLSSILLDLATSHNIRTALQICNRKLYTFGFSLEYIQPSDQRKRRQQQRVNNVTIAILPTLNSISLLFRQITVHYIVHL